MSEPPELPFEITIKRPLETPPARGLYATTVFGNAAKVRLSYYDHERIVRAAALCEVTKASFLRWCAVQVANELLKDQDNEDGQPKEGGN